MPKDILNINVVGTNEIGTITDIEIAVGRTVYALRLLAPGAPLDENGLRLEKTAISTDEIRRLLESTSILEALPHLSLQR